MGDFCISLSDSEVESEGDIVVPGTLILGNYTENFQASLSYWNRLHYLAQWRESLERLLNGKSETAVITTMYDPKIANFILWWIMYLIGDKVHVQNHILFLNELDKPFAEENLYEFIPCRETHTEEGEPISEWIIQLADIRTYICL